MNKVTKTAIMNLFTLLTDNAATTGGKIVSDGEILESVYEIDDPDKEVEVASGHYSTKQFCSTGECSPKILLTIPLVNCPMTGWGRDSSNAEASLRLWLETRDNDTVLNFPNLAEVDSFTGIAAADAGIRIDDAGSGNVIPLGVMGNDNTVYQIPAGSSGTVNADLIAYYVSTVAPSEITPRETDAIINVTLDYR